MKVVVLAGGRSGEYKISRVSARQIVAAVDALGLQWCEAVIEEDGSATFDGATCSMGELFSRLQAWRPDVVFIAMHGADGEDGRVQGALELLGIPYQGSGVAASAVGLDKGRTKAVFRDAGLPVAPDTVLRRDEAPTPDWPAIAEDLGLPLMLKTEASGSSVGIERVDTLTALAERGRALLKETPTLLVERYIEGREFTGAIVETVAGMPEALPIVEIHPKNAAFFDYVAKYTPGATDEICPAPIDDALKQQLQALALRAHQALGCVGYSRTDFMVTRDGRPIVLETNTLPGMTPQSLLPLAADTAGLAFTALVERLLLNAIARKNRADG